MTNQYIGPNKVVGVTKESITTNLGSEVVKVVYENHPDELMTKKAFDLLVTETPPPGDYNYLQNKKFEVLIPMVIDLIMEYDLKHYEIGPFGQRVVDQLFERFHRASHFLWNGTDDGYAPGLDFLLHKSLLDSLKVIENIPKKDVNTDTKPEVGTSTGLKSRESGETTS